MTISGNTAPSLVDAALRRDIDRWHELQREIYPAEAERRKRSEKLPEQFREFKLDPRGFNGSPAASDKRLVALRLGEFEPAYVEAGLGEIDDRLHSLWDEQDPISERLLKSDSSVLAETLALASVYVGILVSRVDPSDDWMVKAAGAATQSLADAERLAGGVV